MFSATASGVEPVGAPRTIADPSARPVGRVAAGAPGDTRLPSIVLADVGLIPNRSGGRGASTPELSSAGTLGRGAPVRQNARTALQRPAVVWPAAPRCSPTIEAMSDVRTRRVGVLGHGAIGSVVADELASGRIAQAELVGVALRDERVGETLPTGRSVGVEELLARSDLVVEAAGQAAFAAHAENVLTTGCDLLAVSTGALADEMVFASIVDARPGRLYLCSGAIGGIDMLRAARELGPIREARITTTKRPGGLVQKRMSEGEVAELLATTERTVLFDGRVEELVTLFPSSTNVAATTALALGSWDVLRGTVIADPAATLTSHVLDVDGASGRYRFEMVNEPSSEHPRSSAVVPWAVVRSLRDLCSGTWTFI